jgi:hypothetical protein
VHPREEPRQDLLRIQAPQRYQLPRFGRDAPRDFSISESLVLTLPGDMQSASTKAR